MNSTSNLFNEFMKSLQKGVVNMEIKMIEAILGNQQWTTEGLQRYLEGIRMQKLKELVKLENTRSKKGKERFSSLKDEINDLERYIHIVSNFVKLYEYLELRRKIENKDE